jgi:hypothetical protein
MADPASAAPTAPAPGSLTGVTYSPSAPAPAARAPAAAAGPGVIEDRAYDALEPSRQAEYARVRKDGEQGGSEWRRRSDLTPDGKPKPAPAPGDPATSVTPDGKLRIGEGETAFELSADDVAELMKTRAELDLRATRVPADGVYQPTLPPDYKLPEGVEFKIDISDPSYVELAAFAKARGWTQEEFSSILQVEAARRVREQQAFKAAVDKEIAALGVTGTSRITAIETWIPGQVGDDLGSALRGMTVTEKIVRGFEALAAKHTTQGHARSLKLTA